MSDASGDVFRIVRPEPPHPPVRGDRFEVGDGVLRALLVEPRGHVDVELTGQDQAIVYVEEDDISYVIGKGGGRISDIEDRLGIDIDVRTHDENPNAGSSGDEEPTTVGGPQGEVVQPEITGRHVVIRMDDHVGETVEVRAGGDYLFTATVGRGGDVQVSRGSAIAEELEDAIDRRQQVTVVPA